MHDRPSGPSWLARLGIGTRVQWEEQEPRKDPYCVRKANVVLIVVSVAWTCAVYIWRLCYPMLTNQPSALGSRRSAIGLLAGFCVLWLMGRWAR